MSTNMIIDSHCHPNWHGHDTEAMVKNMDSMGISKAWLLTWEIEPSECEPSYTGVIDPRWNCISLASVLEACHRYPDRFIPFYAPDPRIPGNLSRLRSAVEIHGIRGCGELKLRMCLDNPDAMALYHLCAELGLPVVFHLDIPLPPNKPVDRWTWWYGGTLGALERALRDCPRTLFVGHAPGFWRYISGDADQREDAYPMGPVTPGGELLRLFKTYPNLYADLSAGSGLNAIRRDPAFGRSFLTENQDRLLFGRDQFDRGHLDYLKSLTLPDPVITKILSQNAIRLMERETPLEISVD